MKVIRVVVVDDHTVFREGLKALLARVDHIELVGEAGTSDAAIEVIASTQPDVVLMDLNLPGTGGTAVTAAVAAHQPDVKVLALTMYADDGHLRGALRAGAKGYLLKDADPETIVRAITAVNDGEAIFDRGIAAQVISAAGTPESERPFPSLTDREFEILDRVARGLRNDAIAARMGISTKTVQNNVSSILLKLSASDRAQAVAIARDAGLGSVSH